MRLRTCRCTWHVHGPSHGGSILGLKSAIVAIVLTLSLGTAAAYPEFQFSTGTQRCAECHFSPVGGGLINDYGRDEAATTISDAGDGRFLHGLVELPSWIALGGDVRLAALGKQIRDGSEAAVFPMQADLYARVARDNWSAQVTFGVLEALRQPHDLTERLGSREHYLLYQAASRAWYVRLGRFFPVFGLRLPDHTAYVRRYTGQHSLEEDYAVGVGILEDSWELHVTAMTPLEVGSPLSPVVGRHGAGLAAQLETSGEASTWSVQASVLRDGAGIDSWFGGTWKRWLASSDLLVAAELDAGVIQVPGGTAVGRVVGYGTVHYRPGKPWGAALGAHYFDPDLRLRGDTRAALEGRFAWFPRAHFEVAALVRGAVVNLEVGRGDLLGMLQLHYYL
ncbi:hypothetical protein BH11MYX3_BH11MYX3_38680 [soil metagenome]